MLHTVSIPIFIILKVSVRDINMRIFLGQPNDFLKPFEAKEEIELLGGLGRSPS